MSANPPSGPADGPPVDEAYALGAVDYLVKPLVPAILRAKVDTFVNLARQAARIRDLERRHAESALRESEDRFRHIVESATDFAILSTDLEGRIHTWSRGAERLFGYGEGEAVGRGIGLLFPPEAVAQGDPGREMDRALR